MHAKNLGFELAVLAGRARALHEHAAKLSIEKAAREFRQVSYVFKELAGPASGDTGASADAHHDFIKQISYDLAAARYILEERSALPAAKLIQQACGLIDRISKAQIGLELIAPIYSVFVRYRGVTQGAKAALLLSENISFRQIDSGSSRGRQAKRVGKNKVSNRPAKGTGVNRTSKNMGAKQSVSRRPSASRKKAAARGKMRGAANSGAAHQKHEATSASRRNAGPVDLGYARVWRPPPPVPKKYRVEVVGRKSISEE